METKNMKKCIWIFLLCCLPVSNMLWYIAYSAGDESVSTSLVILTSFLPALTALVLCKVSKEGWNNHKFFPNIREAWKVYLFAVIGALDDELKDIRSGVQSLTTISGELEQEMAKFKLSR